MVSLKSTPSVYIAKIISTVSTIYLMLVSPEEIKTLRSVMIASGKLTQFSFQVSNFYRNRLLGLFLLKFFAAAFTLFDIPATACTLFARRAFNILY